MYLFSWGGWGVRGLPAQISGSPVLVVQVPKIFGVRRRVSQPMTGTRCWSEKPRGGGRWSLCWAPSWVEGAWWRWAYYVWGTLHQTGDDNLVDIPWRQQNHHWATRPKIPQDRKNRVRQSKVLTFQHSPFQPNQPESGSHCIALVKVSVPLSML